MISTGTIARKLTRKEKHINERTFPGLSIVIGKMGGSSNMNVYQKIYRHSKNLEQVIEKEKNIVLKNVSVLLKLMHCSHVGLVLLKLVDYLKVLNEMR